MLVVALTGGIGSGKSLAGEYFAKLGALVLDADQLSRIAIERGTDGFDEVIATFGDSILKNGEIDRRALGEIVFKDKLAKAKLEAIIHPRVRSEFERAVARLSSDDILIYEIPLLFETQGAGRFDYVVTVESEMEKRIARLRAKGLHISEIQSRIAAQATPDERASIADIVIANDGSEDELLRAVENLFEGELQPKSRSNTSHK